MEAYTETQGAASDGHPDDGCPDDGRPDGAAEARRRYIVALADTFEEHGREILKKVRDDEPEKFWLFISGVMRCEEALRLARDPSDEDLDIVVARVVAGLRQGPPGEKR